MSDNESSTTSSDGSDSDSDGSIGIPGGDDLIFVPTNKRDNASNNNNADESSSSASSISENDSSVGVPGGGDELVFVPTSTKYSKEKPAINHGTNNASNNNNADDSSISASSISENDSSVGVPGGGDDLVFVPTNTNHSKVKRGVTINTKTDDDYKFVGYGSGTPDSNNSPSPPALIPHFTSAKSVVKWDLVYMTASPLVYRKGGVDRALEILNISKEYNQFMNVLAASNKRISVIHKTATSDNLMDAVTHKCSMLHYSGHGFKGYLAFEDSQRIGVTHMISAQQFREMISKMDTLQLVFTSACHSENVGKAFVKAGVKHVVSILSEYEVSDEGAIIFTHHFYNALLGGRTIQDSFDIATKSVDALQGSARLDSKKFRLMPKKGNHNLALFDHLDNGVLINKTKPLPLNNLAAAIVPFVGRSIEMMEIIKELMGKDQQVKMLNVWGKSGMGKSAVCLMVARYLNARKQYFKTGVFFIDVYRFLFQKEAHTLSQMIYIAIKKSFVLTQGTNSNSNSNSNSIAGELTTMKNGHILDALNKVHSSDSNGLLNFLKQFCSNSLFVIDGIDSLIQLNSVLNCNSTRDYQFIYQLISEIEHCKLIVTSEGRMASRELNDIFARGNANSVIPKYQLKELTKVSTAQLLHKLCGQFSPSDIQQNTDLLGIMKNTPSLIHEISKLKHDFDIRYLSKIVPKYKQKKTMQNTSKNKQNLLFKKYLKESQIQQYIKNSLAQQIWRKATKKLKICNFHNLFIILKDEFRDVTYSNRGLEQQDLIGVFRTMRMNQDLTINIDTFDTIYSWFSGLTKLVGVFGQYWNSTNPILIHGFLDRRQSEQELRNSTVQPGTFLIRFRYKEARSIAISYRTTNNQRPVGHLKADLSQSDGNSFVFAMQGSRKVMPLSNFVLQCNLLKYVYCKPSANGQNQLILKQNVFQVQPPAQQAAPSFGHAASVQPQAGYGRNPNAIPQMYTQAVSYSPYSKQPGTKQKIPTNFNQRK